jgi:signal transduction histidine kinase
VSFRARLLFAFAVAVVAPLVFLAVWIPREMTRRFSTEYQSRVAALAKVGQAGLASESARIKSQLSNAAEQLRVDNSLRPALLDPTAARDSLLEHARKAMDAAGLSVLQIRNDSGRILSSGHFRNEYDRVDLGLPGAIASSGGLVLVSLRTSAGTINALLRVDSARVGGRTFTLVGGTAFDDAAVARLAGMPSLPPQIILPSRVSGAGVPPNPEPGQSGSISPVRQLAMVDSISIPYIDATEPALITGAARILVSESTTALEAAQRDVRRSILGTVLVALAFALAAAIWLSRRLSRPLTDLAAQTARIDLDRPDPQFAAAARDDEVGLLARRLQAMVERLRGSAVRVRDAERRATVGEVARQVNHDIKNGLAPIRNVVRHLAQVARETPSELPSIFTARQATLESSISYLETLAQNYARLTPRLDATSCDANAAVEDAVRTASARGSTIRARTAPTVSPVLADAVVLRRILENLVGNAVDSLENKPGEVTVSTEPVAVPGAPTMVRFSVADTGRGMTERELAKAFDDFYTTKPGGTGLGLSVVRRLVADLNGALRIETEPGKGTRVVIDLPAKPPTSAGVTPPTPAGARTAP